MKEIKEDIIIPENVEVNIEDSNVSVKGNKGFLKRKFGYYGLDISKKDNKIILNIKKGSQRDKAMLRTYAAHIKNMIKGVNDGVTYRLKICYSHFPMSVSVDKNFFVIKNFLGEKNPRKAKIMEGVDVKVEGDEVILNGNDREMVGLTASNIEQSCRRTGFDRRRFQDGLYIISKGRI